MVVVIFVIMKMGKKNIGIVFDCFIIYDLDMIYKYIIIIRIGLKFKNLNCFFLL